MTGSPLSSSNSRCPICPSDGRSANGCINADRASPDDIVSSCGDCCPKVGSGRVRDGLKPRRVDCGVPSCSGLNKFEPAMDDPSIDCRGRGLPSFSFITSSTITVRLSAAPSLAISVAVSIHRWRLASGEFQSVIPFATVFPMPWSAPPHACPLI